MHTRNFTQTASIFLMQHLRIAQSNYDTYHDVKHS